MRTETSILRQMAWWGGVALTALLLACMLLGAWAGYIDPVVWAFPSMLCLVFPVLWLMALVAGLLWLLFSRRKVYAAVCGAALLAGVPTMLAVSPFRFPKALQPGEIPLTIMTYNVAVLQDLELGKGAEYSRSVSYILEQDPDIVCLQELFSFTDTNRGGTVTPAQIDSLRTLYPHWITDRPEEGVLLSKYPVELVSANADRDSNYFSYQFYRISAGGFPITVVNVHLSSYRLTMHERGIAGHLKEHPEEVLDKEDNISLYRKLRSAFEQRALAARSLSAMLDTVSGPLIVCGDFNDVPGSYAWRTLCRAGLEDAYCKAGCGPMITFNANHLFFHIDQVLYRPDCGLRPYEVSRGSLKSSDHYPVVARFALSPSEIKYSD